MMKKMFFVLVGSICFSACTKERAERLPDVDTILPDAAAVGATVVVTGTAFSGVPAENQVTFNGVAGTVSAATPTQLTVKVPNNAFTDELRAAEVFVTTEGRRSISSVYLKSDRFPEITSIEPNSGRVGTIITIRGRNLNPDVNTSAVVFWNSTATPPLRTPLAATATAIQVTVPAGTRTGDVCLMTYVTADKTKYLSDCRVFTVIP